GKSLKAFAAQSLGLTFPRKCCIPIQKMIRASPQDLYEEKNREFLERFYEENNVVVSAPQVFFLVGEHAVLRGAPALCVRIPFRVFVGLEKTRFPWNSSSKPAIAFGDEYLFDWNAKSEPRWRVPAPLEGVEKESKESNRKRVLDVLHRIVERENLRENAFRINILSPLPPGRGANWSGAFSAALATALLVLNERISPKDIERWANLPASEAINDPKFRLCNHLAWQIENELHRGRASGYGTCLSLLWTKYSSPVLYFTQARSDNPAYGCPPMTISTDEAPEKLQRIKYYACELPELLPEPERSSASQTSVGLDSKSFPIRIYLVDSARPKFTDQSIRKSLTVESLLEKSWPSLREAVEKVTKTPATF
ncbi:MAG: hypothetical protein ABDI20_08620, partial [Candidatus Bipolaricaulaceae bacterium]